MYNYNDERYLGSNTVSSLSLSTKKVNPCLRRGFDVHNFGQLPAIKEEGGLSSEDELEKNTKGIKHAPSFTRLPPLNINCLMNVDVKQSHSIWNTNFGKRLISKNTVCGVLSQPDLNKSLYVKKNSKKCQTPKPLMRNKFVRNCKNGKYDKMKFNQNENHRKKSKKVSKENQNLTEKEISPDKRSSSAISITKQTERSIEIPNTELPLETSTLSTQSKPQFLTDYVRSIFGNCYDESKCEHCDKTFSDIKELCNHQKQHEMEKETCLLCEKVFYDPSKFVQHLLTHEGVDRFSCKKCMKYFPNLKKYKEHNLEFHYKPPPTFSYISPPKQKFVEEWLPKFECKRCKIELDSAKAYEAHRRAHIRKDLARAYLLSLNNM